MNSWIRGTEKYLSNQWLHGYLVDDYLWDGKLILNFKIYKNKFFMFFILILYIVLSKYFFQIVKIQFFANLLKTNNCNLFAIHYK